MAGGEISEDHAREIVRSAFRDRDIGGGAPGRRLAIATLYDAGIAEYADWANAAVRIYAKQHGYALITVRERLSSDRAAQWDKVRLMRFLLEDPEAAQAYDYFCWIDADAAFAQLGTRLLEDRVDVYLNPTAQPGSAQPSAQPLGAQPLGAQPKNLLIGDDAPNYHTDNRSSASTDEDYRMNTGVFVARSCAWCRDLMRLWWESPIARNWLYNPSFDQGALWEMYKAPGNEALRAQTVLAPAEAINSVYSSLPNPAAGAAGKDTFVVHMMACPTERRRRVFQALYERLHTESTGKSRPLEAYPPVLQARAELATSQSTCSWLQITGLALTLCTSLIAVLLISRRVFSPEYAARASYAALALLVSSIIVYGLAILQYSSTQTTEEKLEYVAAVDRVLAAGSRGLQHEGGEYGIVVCAGGFRNVECTGGLLWIRELERRGNMPSMPVEWYYVGDDEVSPAARAYLEERIGNVRFVDCEKLYGNSAILRGFPIKPFALTRSHFRHAVLLDSDCISVHHPSTLFQSESYKRNENLFWPDFGHRGTISTSVLSDKVVEFMSSSGANLKAEDISLARSMPESESGQVFVNRERYARELEIAWRLNENKEVWYKYAYGDKDLFMLGFLIAGEINAFSQVKAMPFSFLNSQDMHESIGQRSPEDPERVAFVHRTHQKRLCSSKTNPCVLVPEEYKIMVLESDAPGETIWSVPKKGLKAKGRKIPADVMDALLFVAGAEREQLQTLAKM